MTSSLIQFDVKTIFLVKNCFRGLNKYKERFDDKIAEYQYVIGITIL